MSSSASVKRIDNVEDLENIGPVWKELQDAGDFQHVMMDHRWVSTWWRHFDHRTAQHTLVVSSGREPIGIVPLAITHGWEAYPLRDPYVMAPDDYRFLPHLRLQRVVPLRRLTYPLNLVSANVRGQAISPLKDTQVLAALGGYAADHADQWDVAVLPGMRSWEQEDLAWSKAAADAGLFPGSRESSWRMLYIELPSTFEEFQRTRSGNFSRHMRKESNKVEKNFVGLGPLTIDCLRGPDISAGMQRMFALEKKSWKVTDEKDRRLHLALDDRARAFFRNVSERFARDDNAQVIIMRFGDTDAAGMFTLERCGVASGILNYRNDQLESPVSVTPLWQEMFRRCIANGIHRLDINGYTRNYLKWTKDYRQFTSQVMFNSSLYSRLLRFVDGGALAISRGLNRRRERLLADAARRSA